MASSYPVCTIPTIDLKPFFVDEGVVIGEEPTQAQLEVASSINDVCQKHGFVHVTNFGLSKKFGNTLFDAAEELFDNPNKVQDYVPWKVQTNIGFSPYRNEALNRNRPGDLKEAFNLKMPPIFPTSDAIQNTPDSFRSIVNEYTSKMKAASIRYGLICALALDLDLDYFTKRIKTFDMCTARFLHYPPCDFEHVTEEKKEAKDVPIRVGEHTDFGAYTFLLLKDGQGPAGLQVKPGQRGGQVGGSAGGEDEGWMDVKIDDNTSSSSDRKHGSSDDDDENGDAFGAIINTGAMMARMTNDFWRATPHRVIVPSQSEASKHRYSIPFFVDPDANELIEVIEKYRSKEEKKSSDNDDHDDVYNKPVTAKDFILMKLKDLDDAVPKN